MNRRQEDVAKRQKSIGLGLICPITLELPFDPVTAEDGYVKHSPRFCIAFAQFGDASHEFGVGLYPSTLQANLRTLGD